MKAPRICDLCQEQVFGIAKAEAKTKEWGQRLKAKRELCKRHYQAFVNAVSFTLQARRVIPGVDGDFDLGIAQTLEQAAIVKETIHE